LTTAIHLEHSQILTKYYYIIKSQYALTVRCHCMLSYLWVVTVFAKRLLTNAFFLFGKIHAILNTWSRFQKSVS